MTALVAGVGVSSAAHPPVLQVVLTDDATLQEHNREYRDEDQPTDVLSFSYLEGHEAHRDALVHGALAVEEFLDGPWPDDEEPLAGQLLVSLQTLQRRGPVHTGERDAELAFMVIHGLLHVLGHDHAEADDARSMREHERNLMARIGYPLMDSVGSDPEGVEH